MAVAVLQRPKWWQEEIIESDPAAAAHGDVSDGQAEFNLDKVQEFVDAFVQQLKAPAVGVTYKVEVPASLALDGTFWACPLSSGFIQDKLEPLSGQLIASIEGGFALKFDGEHDELLCILSEKYNLWMRAVIVKVLNQQTIRLRLVDVGSIEDHHNVKIWKVPKLFASIPYIAFHCTLFDEPTKISYNQKYRFNDLVKKQILNFTCKSINDANGTNVLFGEIETIIDKPVVNINEEVRRMKAKKEETKNPNGIKVTIKNCSNDDNDRVVGCVSDKLGELVGKLSTPTVGTTYKIEVTSPLSPDGTFWACPITKGFIQDKLEPLSDMLKMAILADPGLRKLDDLTGVLCLRSKAINLLTRGILIKEVSERVVKMQLIDTGRIEDHPKDKVFKVPTSLAELPYMALHCSLFEQKVNLSYQERWKFADLCKKKILDFTCGKFFEREKKQLVIGRIENTTEDPVIDITEKIKQAMLSEDI